MSVDADDHACDGRTTPYKPANGFQVSVSPDCYDLIDWADRDSVALAGTLDAGMPGQQPNPAGVTSVFAVQSRFSWYSRRWPCDLCAMFSQQSSAYPLVLTTKARKAERTFMLLVAAGEGGVGSG
jgi:hypothetical protein